MLYRPDQCGRSLIAPDSFSKHFETFSSAFRVLLEALEGWPEVLLDLLEALEGCPKACWKTSTGVIEVSSCEDDLV